MQDILNLPQQQIREQLLHVLRTVAYRPGTFTLSSGQISDFYIDCKQAALTAQGAALLGCAVCYHLAELEQRNIHVDAVGGMTLGADPIATAASIVSYLQGNPKHAFIVRKDTKSYGTKRAIEGIQSLEAGASVLLVEDVVTTGASTLTALQRVQEHGLRPSAILSVVDRSQHGARKLADTGIPYSSLFVREDFVPRQQPV